MGRYLGLVVQPAWANLAYLVRSEPMRDSISKKSGQLLRRTPPVYFDFHSYVTATIETHANTHTHFQMQTRIWQRHS